MEKNRVWLYCRTAQKDEAAIEIQKRRLESYAAEKGFSIAGVSSDQQSGMTLDRPGLLEVNRAVEEKLADIVLVVNLDRISRSAVGTVQYWEYLGQHGVRLHTVSEGKVDLTWNREIFGNLKAIMRQ